MPAFCLLPQTGHTLSSPEASPFKVGTGLGGSSGTGFPQKEQNGPSRSCVTPQWGHLKKDTAEALFSGTAEALFSGTAGVLFSGAAGVFCSGTAEALCADATA